VSDLPRGWAWSTLGAVTDVVSGSTPRTAEPSYWDGDIPWITPDDLSKDRSKRISRGARLITQTGYESCSTRLVPAGTVLYTSRAPIGYVAIAANPVCTNQGFKSFVPSEALTSDYLYWFLHYATPEIRKLGSGTTFAELSKARAREVPIPVGPLAEQRRIVAAIEEHLSRLDAAKSSLGTALARAKRMKLLILNAALGDAPETLPLRDVADVRLGRQRSPKNHSGPTMKPYLRAANVTWDGLKLDDVKEMNFSAAEAGIYELRPRDVLLAEASGSASEVGKPVVWHGEIEDCCFQNTLIRVRSRGPLPEYLRLVFLRSALLGQFAQAAPGVGIHHLGSSRLAEWPIPLPSTDKQAAIAETVEREFSLVEGVQGQLSEVSRRAESLRRAILARAFRGDLVLQDPNDEPAGVLLDRIATERAAAKTKLRSTPSRRQQAVVGAD